MFECRVGWCWFVSVCVGSCRSMTFVSVYDVRVGLWRSLEIVTHSIDVIASERDGRVTRVLC